MTMERLGDAAVGGTARRSVVYGYSLDVLGCVVERASGMPLDKFMRSRITEPLEMRDTGFFLPARHRDRLAAVYSMDATAR